MDESSILFLHLHRLVIIQQDVKTALPRRHRWHHFKVPLTPDEHWAEDPSPPRVWERFIPHLTNGTNGIDGDVWLWPSHIFLLWYDDTLSYIPYTWRKANRLSVVACSFRSSVSRSYVCIIFNHIAARAKMTAELLHSRLAVLFCRSISLSVCHDVWWSRWEGLGGAMIS